MVFSSNFFFLPASHVTTLLQNECIGILRNSIYKDVPCTATAMQWQSYSLQCRNQLGLQQLSSPYPFSSHCYFIIVNLVLPDLSIPFPHNLYHYLDTIKRTVVLNMYSATNKLHSNSKHLFPECWQLTSSNTFRGAKVPTARFSIAKHVRLE